MAAQLTLTLLPEFLAVCRLRSDQDIPQWALGPGFSSTTRAGDELSVVCPQGQVPAGITSERGWRCLKVHGPLGFGLTGILAELAGALAREGISLFALSTYDTDYLLVKAEDLPGAIGALRRRGHDVRTGEL